jgi:hypothetical protein
MKKLMISLALASSALIAATPAAAQGHSRGSIYGQLDRIELRIDRAAQRGALTRPEVRQLRYQVTDIKRVAYRYGRDGVQPWEHRDLERRIDRLQNHLQNQRFDDDRRGWRDRRY